MFDQRERLTEKIEFRLTKKEKENLKQYVKDKNITMSDLIKQALTQYTNENNLTTIDFINLRQIVKVYLNDFTDSKEVAEYKKEVEIILKKIENILPKRKD